MITTGWNEMSTVRDQKHKENKFCPALWKGISPIITGPVLIYSAISSHSGSTISVEQGVQQMALIKFPQSIKDWYFRFRQKNNRGRAEIGICWKNHCNKSRWCGPRVGLLKRKRKMLQSPVWWKICMSQGGYDEWKWNMEHNQRYVR